MNDYIMKLTAIINTLNAATLRADQVDAVQRINACVNEMTAMIKAMQEQENKTEGSLTATAVTE